VTPYEALVRYDIPPEAAAVDVFAEYTCDYSQEFRNLYGVRPQDLKLWDGAARSNTIRIDLGHR
jgi:hypothetical protein